MHAPPCYLLKITVEAGCIYFDDLHLFLIDIPGVNALRSIPLSNFINLKHKIHLYDPFRLNLFTTCTHPPQNDPQLEIYQCTLIMLATNKLDKTKMIRFIEHAGTLHSTDLGCTASNYYIKYASIA